MKRVIWQNAILAVEVFEDKLFIVNKQTRGRYQIIGDFIPGLPFVIEQVDIHLSEDEMERILNPGAHCPYCNRPVVKTGYQTCSSGRWDICERKS